MRGLLAGLLLFTPAAASAAERIVCVKDFLLSSAVGVQKGYNGKDEYLYEPGKVLMEIQDGRVLWRYTQVSEANGLIVGALRQEKHQSDSQVVVIDRRTGEFYKTVKQEPLRFTSFGTCDFSK